MNHNGNHIVILSTLITMNTPQWWLSQVKWLLGILLNQLRQIRSFNMTSIRKDDIRIDAIPDELLNPLIIGRHADTQQRIIMHYRFQNLHRLVA